MPVLDHSAMSRLFFFLPSKKFFAFDCATTARYQLPYCVPSSKSDPVWEQRKDQIHHGVRAWHPPRLALLTEFRQRMIYSEIYSHGLKICRA